MATAPPVQQDQLELPPIVLRRQEFVTRAQIAEKIAFAKERLADGETIRGVRLLRVAIGQTLRLWYIEHSGKTGITVSGAECYLQKLRSAGVINAWIWRLLSQAIAAQKTCSPMSAPLTAALAEGLLAATDRRANR